MHCFSIGFGARRVGLILVIYNVIVKNTRHKYHYTVRRLKKEKINIKKRLAETSCNGKLFWNNINKMNPTSSMLSDVVDNINTPKDVAPLLCGKYKNLYTSLPTNEVDLNQIDSVIIDRLNCIYYLVCIITPMIITSCISKLKTDKPDGDIAFNSNHLIHGSQRVDVMLSMLFNAMLYHGYYPSD